MNGQALISLAMLKANWDEYRKDYVENFVPFVVECIIATKPLVVSAPAIQEQLQTMFAIELPRSAVQVILKRTKSQKLLYQEDGVLKPDWARLSSSNFDQIRNDFIQKHARVVDLLRTYANEQYKIIWDLPTAESALQAYLDENEVNFFKVDGGTVIPHTEYPAKSAKYIVAKFVQNLFDNHAKEFEFLETVVKGSMLAVALFLPEPPQTRKFEQIAVYFDTGFLIHVLGYSGMQRQAPCQELLNLLYKSGASLHCFRHTIEEVRNALHACVERIDSPDEAYGPTRESVDYFLERDFTSSDILMLIGQLEDDLATRHITIVEKPDYSEPHHAYVIDEEALSAYFDQNINYLSNHALALDVASIAAIMRLRKGCVTSHIEKAKAIFVTTNSRLAGVTARYFSGIQGETTVSPCITDQHLTVLLWLKQPQKAPDLPRKRLLADCYAAVQPDGKLWARFVQEIEKLRKRKCLDDELVYVLRGSTEARTAMMEVTLGDQSAFTDGTVAEIIEHMKKQISAEQEAKYKEELIRRQKLEEEIAASHAREEQRLRQIDKRAMQVAAWAKNTLKMLIITTLILGALYMFPWEFPKSLPHYILFACAVIGLIYTVIDYSKSGLIEQFLRRIELSLVPRVRELLVHITE